MTIIDQAIFDELKQMSGPDFMPELIDTFLEDAPRMLSDLQRTLEAGDSEGFRRTAHSLKSNAKTFGAQDLAESARELELIGRENRLKDASPKLEQLRTEYERVAEALKGLRDG
jgi:HPt (histidine-containing phosphotransfer) domain-containing protein